ncbi:fibroblast growth factor 18 isoform X1 [Passer montanus]|uniref:fibroblast growth factor 18 isoform X1 n=1 Tax=Passer montanus TaxID=9160 RepID=UPI00195FAC0A|nr:fibroblast growth factor 18 isoform X1 [Passer montanus]XP_039555400.1 fibroblast growth factor 18 isoform X1 [Passer montanus]
MPDESLGGGRAGGTTTSRRRGAARSSAARIGARRPDRSHVSAAAGDCAPLATSRRPTPSSPSDVFTALSLHLPMFTFPAAVRSGTGMRPLEEHPERGSAAQVPAGWGWSCPTASGILAGHPGADPPAGPRRAGATSVAAATFPSELRDTCDTLGPELYFGRDCTCSPSPDPQRQQGMVLDEHSLGGGSIPLAKLKPEPAPSPALPPIQKMPDHVFFLIPSKNCSSNLAPAEPPLVEQPPQQERIRSCKLPSRWKVFALFLWCGFFSARGITGCAGLAAPEPFVAGGGFFALVR